MKQLFHRDVKSELELPEGTALSDPHPFTEDEVTSAFKKLGRNKAPGEDQLRDTHLRNLAKEPEVKTHMTNELNRWFAAGKVPSYANRAIVIPLSKQDTEYPELGKVRPIAVLPAVFKLYETLIH